MANLGLGIDAGGTFTDGVIFDLDRREIIVKAKVITTRHNLALGIERCLDDLLGHGDLVDLKHIRMVALSTTLATNAIVEGQGAEVGLILIGFTSLRDLPTQHVAYVAGGCNIKGEIETTVDLVAAEKAILEMRDKVDAFAVSGYLSVRNPAQELQVQELIHDLTGHPVVAGHHLTTALGLQERTVTAVLNARLIPLIAELMSSVRQCAATRGIHAPLMVVRGDGSLMREEVARGKPIETILSGPAASIVGALALTGLEDGMVVDMGGTTTDMALVREGRPALNREGAKVGDWFTRVRAAEITTIGLGGDSLIHVTEKGVMSVGPQRVFPLAWVASLYPYLADELAAIRESEYTLYQTPPSVALVFIKDPLHLKLSGAEERIVELLRESPHTLYYLSAKLNKELDLLPWQRLVRVGSLHRASLTPTDLLHVTGGFTAWNREAAGLGVKIMARRYRTSAEVFVKDALEEIHFALGALVIDRLAAADRQAPPSLLDGEGSHYLLRRMLADEDLDASAPEFSVKVHVPLVAVGAPVSAFLPAVARKLGAHLLVPESAEVANAVGTVSGQVTERVSLLIKPGEGGGVVVHGPRCRKAFKEFPEAATYAREEGRRIVSERAAATTPGQVEVLVSQRDKYAPLEGASDGAGAEARVFIESVVEVSAFGQPWTDQP